MGQVHWLFAARDPKHLDDAIREFEHVLTIDPEDLTAHYRLMHCYSAKGPGFERQMERHRALYLRFKADESTTHLQGPYKLKNPWDNVESITIHEHGPGQPMQSAPPTIVKKLVSNKVALNQPPSRKRL